MGAMIGFFYFTTQYLQDALGFTPLQAGLGFLPVTIVNFAVAMAIPCLGWRLPNGVLLVIGVVLTFAGMAWLSRLRPTDLSGQELRRPAAVPPGEGADGT
jgi:uncharacterized membrane protein